MKPIYKHDCNECKFVGTIFRTLNKHFDDEGHQLGRRVETDVYLSCELSSSTPLLLRCSDEGSDYITTSYRDLGWYL